MGVLGGLTVISFNERRLLLKNMFQTHRLNLCGYGDLCLNIQQ